MKCFKPRDGDRDNGPGDTRGSGPRQDGPRSNQAHHPVLVADRVEIVFRAVQSQSMSGRAPPHGVSRLE